MRAPSSRAREALIRFQQRREETARELLEAARRVLAFKGYHHTRIVDIARAADVGVGTFYLYYPTKQAIFLELVEDAIRRLKAELDRARASATDPRARARIGIETFFRFAQDNRELFRIVFGHSPAFDEVVRRAQERFIRDSIDNIEEGIRAGVFRATNAHVVAHALMGMSMQVVSWWLDQSNVAIEQVTETLLDFVANGLIRREPEA